MTRKRKKESKANNAVLPVMRPDAAGIDIGATEIFVAVAPDRAAENVRSFPTFTQDLYALADWLKQCGVKTVAMESVEDERVLELPIVARKRVIPVEQRGPAVCHGSNEMEGKGEMRKAPISLQDLRRSLYVKAKAEPAWRFWGLYVHVCKMETLQEASGITQKRPMVIT